MFNQAYLIGKNLCRIADEKYYEIDDFKSIEDYCKSKIQIGRSTIYDNMGLYRVYGDSLESVSKIGKLICTLSFLNSKKLNKIDPKKATTEDLEAFQKKIESYKKEFLELAKTGTFEDIKKRLEEVKEIEGITKKATVSKKKPSVFKAFEKKLPKTLSDNEKAEVKALIEKLQSLLSEEDTEKKAA
ncbi:MAG TPA: hypothetical protein PLG34_10665 [Spirochaetota bacterium]|nr:hypothetical protein [Spirochaetota bacterium]HPY88429.1 hypothetical protein [Spirochaetota bacterium]